MYLPVSALPLVGSRVDGFTLMGLFVMLEGCWRMSGVLKGVLNGVKMCWRIIECGRRCVRVCWCVRV